MRIKYIGEKPHGRADTVADTGTVWAAPGDVQDVPEAAVPKLLKHPDIWQVADVETKTYADGTVATGLAPLPDQSPAEQGAAPRFTLDLEGGEKLVLDARDDEFLKGFADANGLKVDKRKKGDALRAAVHEAAIAAQAQAAVEPAAG